MLCHSPILLFSFRILLFPLEFCYSFFWFFFMPLWILLFSFQFYYSLSNYVMQFYYPIIRLYRPLMQFRILLFPFKFRCSLFQFYHAIMNSFIQSPILLFAFELCSSKSETSFIWPTVPWGPVTDWFPEFQRYRKTWRTWKLNKRIHNGIIKSEKRITEFERE